MPVGGLLNATLGNLTELIIALAALHTGEYMLVKASIAGAIVTNLLFMLGVSCAAELRQAEANEEGRRIIVECNHRIGRRILEELTGLGAKLGPKTSLFVPRS
jgi:Ca2+/Na+ antiporter